MKKHTIILTVIISLLLVSYGFIRLLPTKLINLPSPVLYNAAIKLQDFALKHNMMIFPSIYKSEIEKHFEKSLPEGKKQADEVMLKVQEYHNKFMAKNNKILLRQDYLNKMDDYEIELEGILFDVYAEALKITDKYLLIPIGGLPTSYYDVIENAFYPYSRKYNVNLSKAIELDNYVFSKQDEIEKYIHKVSNINFKESKNPKSRLISSYPKQGFYYYYYEKFNPLEFEKPEEIIPVYGTYSMFVYDENLPESHFDGISIWNEKIKAYDNYMQIKDDGGYLFDMILVGLEFKPAYYVREHPNCHNGYNGKCLDICKFNKNNNKQIKYTLNPESGEIVKQMEFDNGEVSLGNLCNPDWIPGVDI